MDRRSICFGSAADSDKPGLVGAHGDSVRAPVNRRPQVLPRLTLNAHLARLLSKGILGMSHLARSSGDENVLLGLGLDVIGYGFTRRKGVLSLRDGVRDGVLRVDTLFADSNALPAAVALESDKVVSSTRRDEADTAHARDATVAVAALASDVHVIDARAVVAYELIANDLGDIGHIGLGRVLPRLAVGGLGEHLTCGTTFGECLGNILPRFAVGGLGENLPLRSTLRKSFGDILPRFAVIGLSEHLTCGTTFGECLGNIDSIYSSLNSLLGHKILVGRILSVRKGIQGNIIDCVAIELENRSTISDTNLKYRPLCSVIRRVIHAQIRVVLPVGRSSSPELCVSSSAMDCDAVDFARSADVNVLFLITDTISGREINILQDITISISEELLPRLLVRSIHENRISHTVLGVFSSLLSSLCRSLRVLSSLLSITRNGRELDDLRIDFRKLGIDFRKLGIDLCKLGIDFRIDFRKLGIDLCKLGIDFRIDFCKLGIDFCKLRIDFCKLRIDRLNLILCRIGCSLSILSSIEKLTEKTCALFLRKLAGIQARFDNLEGIRRCDSNKSNRASRIITRDRAIYPSDFLGNLRGYRDGFAVVIHLNSVISRTENDNRRYALPLSIKIEGDCVGLDVVLNELGNIDIEIPLSDSNDMIIRKTLGRTSKYIVNVIKVSPFGQVTHLLRY